jgi:phospho-N-acetylmuramoyl-pentapeptide-transferase
MIISLALAGASIPFLFLNMPPARLFMGDVGALSIGALLGCLLLEITFVVLVRDFHTWSINQYILMMISLGLISLVLFLELIFVPIQIFSVKVFKRRLPIRTPIHHTFEYWGWPESRILWLFILVQLICSAAGLSLFALK